MLTYIFSQMPHIGYRMTKLMQSINIL